MKIKTFIQVFFNHKHSSLFLSKNTSTRKFLHFDFQLRSSRVHPQAIFIHQSTVTRKKDSNVILLTLIVSYGRGRIVEVRLETLQTYTQVEERAVKPVKKATISIKGWDDPCWGEERY